MNRLKAPIAILLLMLFLAGEPERSPAMRDLGPPAPAEVIGQGFWSVLACGGCVAGALALIWGGWGAVLVAAMRPGSTLVVAGCIGACVNAVK